MRMKPKNSNPLSVEQSLLNAGHVYLYAASELTPAEARRVAAALVKEAEKAEKKGKK